jgi:hypothetical protein
LIFPPFVNFTALLRSSDDLLQARGSPVTWSWCGSRTVCGDMGFGGGPIRRQRGFDDLAGATGFGRAAARLAIRLTSSRSSMDPPARARR